MLTAWRHERPRTNKIRKALKQEIGYLKRNLASNGSLTACD